MSQAQREQYYQGSNTTYRYFSEEEVKSTFNISSNPGAVIINFKTRDVISVNGFKFDGRTFYTLNDLR